MAVLHSLEESFYGPEMRLSGSALKILLYLRHRALRDWTKRKVIGKAEIMKATGVKARMTDYALRELERENHISVTRSRTGKVWNDNVYELNSKRYGDDYIFRPEKPSFRVIYGSKGHKSNQTLVQPLAPGVMLSTAPGVVQPLAPGDVYNYSESLTNLPPKNPLKEPIKKTLSEDMDFQESETESEATKVAAAKAAIHRLATMRRMPV